MGGLVLAFGWSGGAGGPARSALMERGARFAFSRSALMQRGVRFAFCENAPMLCWLLSQRRQSFPCSVALVSFCPGAFPCSVALVFCFWARLWVDQHGLCEGVQNIYKTNAF